MQILRQSIVINAEFAIISIISEWIAFPQTTCEFEDLSLIGFNWLNFDIQEFRSTRNWNFNVQVNRRDNVVTNNVAMLSGRMANVYLGYMLVSR